MPIAVASTATQPTSPPPLPFPWQVAPEAAIAIALPVQRPAVLAPNTADAPAPLAQTAQPQPAGIPTPLPTDLTFGAAMRAIDPVDDRNSTDPLATPTVLALATPAAPAPSPALQLDLRQDRWPHDMITHIESLRDAADAADTRIRLLPDALGQIEVDVRRDGDTLHVRFNAEQPQTRALLQDAQPRLAEAAEARGLRLGQASVDAGAAGQGQQRPPTPSQAPQTRRPSSRAADPETPADDARIA